MSGRAEGDDPDRRETLSTRQGGERCIRWGVSTAGKIFIKAGAQTIERRTFSEGRGLIPLMIAPSVLLYVIDFFDCRVVFLCTSLLDISHPHLDGRKQQVKTICGRTCCARYCCRKPKVDEIMSREVDCYFYLL